MQITYLDAGWNELLEANDWYEEQGSDIAERFILEWKRANRRMVGDPETNRAFHGNYRRCRFDVFPYALIYRITEEATVEVTAVMHQHRAPGYWSDR